VSISPVFTLGGTAAASAGDEGALATSGQVLEQFDHFLTPPTISNITSLYGELLVSASGAGAGIGAVASNEQRRPGVIGLLMGTTTAGRGGVHTFRDGIRFGGGTWRTRWGVRPTVLSTVAQEYALVIGFAELITGLTQADGAFFLYDRLGSHTGSPGGANWIAVTCKAGGRTFTDTGVAVSTSTWADLDIRVNAAASSVGFYIGGALEATHTTNIPSASSEQTSVIACAFKSAGTTDLPVHLDYYGVRAVLNP